jgi:flagellar basal-body rod protein FlgB
MFHVKQYKCLLSLTELECIGTQFAYVFIRTHEGASMAIMDGIFQKNRTNDLDYALKVLGEKNKVLSRNIANVDTPFYKADKLVFAEAMADYYNENKRKPMYVTNPRHMQAGGEAQALTLTDARHISPILTSENSITEHIRNQNNPSLRTDGNDVNLDFEMSEQANTSILYSMFTQMVGGKFGTLKEIIRTR